MTEDDVAAVETVSESAAAPKRVRTTPKWEETATERVRSGIKRFAKPLSELVARDANEGDTRLLVTDFLCEALGFDKYTDLTTEYRVRGEFADFGVRIDKELIAFIETKRVATKLNIRHLRQVQSYAVNEGVEWMILTNGVEWNVYHLSGGLPIVTELALTVDLLGPETVAQKAKKMFLLTRESLKRGRIELLWAAKRATSPRALGEILRSDAVVDAIRREIRRTSGHKITGEEVVQLLEETVLRPECLEK